MRRSLLLVTICAIAYVTPLAAQIAFPALTGRVVDQANVLSAETERALADASQKFEQATTNQLVVATLASLQGQTIEDFGYQLGRQWGIGRAGKNNGVLILVAPTERAVRIEVGYGLEGTLTDAVARGIVEQQIIPRFRDNDFDNGVRAGVETIIAVLSGDGATASRMAEAGSRRIKSPVAGDTFVLPIFILVFLALFFMRHTWGMRRRGPWGIGMGGPGRSRGGGFGGGGFRGGGGSFGGGGASGRW